MIHKYIRHSTVGFILWPARDPWHSDLADAVVRSAGGRIVSAGFCTVGVTRAFCYGRSESLNLNAAPDDSQALTDQLGLGS